MKKILLQLDGDRFASVFDAVTAYDAGVDCVLQQAGVTPGVVRSLVYGAIFTRGGDDLKKSALFIGGSDVSPAEAILQAAKDAFFGPQKISVMFDPNGCNTTAAAAVKKLLSKGAINRKKIVILAGTGPVGMRAAALLAREGALVTLTSRSLERSQKACSLINKRFGVDVRSTVVFDNKSRESVLEGAYGVLCAGAPGVTLIPRLLWSHHPDLQLLGDVNAVPPLGIEGSKSTWDGKEKNGKTVFGALGIGGLKIKIHRYSISRLFDQNDLILDAEEIYDLAGEM